MKPRPSYRYDDVVLHGLEALSDAPRVPALFNRVAGGLALVRGAVDDGLDRLAMRTDELNMRTVTADALAEQQRAKRLAQAIEAFRETKQR